MLDGKMPTEFCDCINKIGRIPEQDDPPTKKFVGHEAPFLDLVDKRDDYTINAMGQRVPKATAIHTGGALHNDEPL